ncbi:MAG TPA: hypothetical protein EYP16_07140 [Candidatus Atribacteria bacterium]|nr:hypothetical protein [Candidatus Atribacteria bacterium]
MCKYDVVLVGHLAKDKIIFRGKEREAQGGAPFYGAFPLLRMDKRVGIVTKLKKEDFYITAPLVRELNLSLFVTFTKNTTGIENIYPTDDVDYRISKLIEMADSFELKDFPEISTSVYHIAPLIKGEVGIDVISFLKKKAKIGLDVQGFVRVLEKGELVYRDWEEKFDILPLVDFLKTDLKEAEILTSTSDPLEASKTLAKWGAKEVLITRKEGVSVYVNGEYYEAPFNPSKIVGRTGRGDTCMASYIGKRLEDNPKKALEFAAKITSKKLEIDGPFNERLEF